MQAAKDKVVRIKYIGGHVQDVDKQLAPFMFGTTENIATPEYVYYNWEQKWYSVKTAKTEIMVRMDGEGKRIMITGLVNPQLNLAFRSVKHFR